MRRSPFCAAGLSLLLPGAGQLYNGERAKGLAILCIDAGIGVGLALATIGPAALRSWLTAAVLGLAYLLIWIPAVMDAHQYASGTAKPLLSGERRWYVMFLLVSVGPGAIPLLWQSPRFSRKAKIVWTVAVILIALFLILLTIVIGPSLEEAVHSLAPDDHLQALLEQLLR